MSTKIFTGYTTSHTPVSFTLEDVSALADLGNGYEVILSTDEVLEINSDTFCSIKKAFVFPGSDDDYYDVDDED